MPCPRFSGCVAFNPGSFATSGKWMVYHAQSRTAESSGV